MILPCFMAPTENPYMLRSVKKALLTYDKVILAEPSDRDIMPETLLASAWTNMPPFISGGFLTGHAVRPLGKVIGYDDQFDRLIETLRPAVAQGLVDVVSTYDVPIVSAAQHFFGGAPSFGYPLQPKLIFDVYRNLVSDVGLIRSIIESSKHSLIKNIRDNDSFSKGGTMDGSFGGSSPLPVLELEGLSAELNVKLTQVARARIGAFIKYSGYCEKKEMVPVFDNAVYGNIFSELILKSERTITEIEDDFLWLRRNRMLELCHREFMEDEVLDSMSVEQVIRYRSIAWGRHAEHRDNLFKSIEELAVEYDSEGLYSSKAECVIQEFKKQSEELLNEREKLKFEVNMDIVKGLSAAAPVVLGVSGHISPGISIVLTLLSAVPGVVDYFVKHEDTRNKILQSERQLKRSACFGIHNFYSRMR